MLLLDSFETAIKKWLQTSKNVLRSNKNTIPSIV